MSGLLGAAIGASAALGAQAMNNAHQRDTERQREVSDLLAQFWEAADRMWRHSGEYESLRRSASLAEAIVRGTVVIQPLVDIPETREQRERREGYESAVRHRDEARAAYVAADAEAGVLIGRMRLRAVAVTPEAIELRQCSRYVDERKSHVLHQRHDAALDAYESRARDVIQGVTRPRIWWQVWRPRLRG